MPEFGFDGEETSNAQGCEECGKPLHEHEKERVYDDKGPSGSYHYEYICP